MNASVERKQRPTIGIVTGSGPEAGIDMWAKVLEHNATFLGSSFRGDQDAPKMVIYSEPELGRSMDLEENAETVWQSLHYAISELSPQVDYYAIACNTLNWYAGRINEAEFSADLVSFQTVIEDWLERTNVKNVALLGSLPVTALGAFSPYRWMLERIDPEIPKDPDALHELILDVKRLGGGDPSLRERLAAIVEPLESDHVLLACTELPLIADIETSKKLVDVTDLVAQELVARSHAG